MDDDYYENTKEAMNMGMIKKVRKELERVKELLKVYEEAGPEGTFTKVMVETSIKRAEDALDFGSVVELIDVYRELKAIE